MTIPALAWTVAYGFRPKLVHIRLNRWIWAHARFYNSVKETIDHVLPIVIAVLQHQHAQGFLASVETDQFCNPVLEHPAWDAAFGMAEHNRPKPNCPWRWSSVGTLCAQCHDSPALVGRTDFLTNWPLSRMTLPCHHGELAESGMRPAATTSVMAQFAVQAGQAISAVPRKTALSKERS